VCAGDEISAYYDPMIAKLVVHGDDRAAALRRLAEALAGYEIVGVSTNVSFLQRVVAHDAFASGRVDTGLIARHHDALFPAPSPTPVDAIVAAALAEVLGLVRARAAAAAASGDPGSPWHAVDPWWPNSGEHAIALSFADADLRHDVSVRRDGGGWRLLHEGREVRALVRERDGRLVITADGAEFVATVVAHGEERHVFLGGAHGRLGFVDRLAHAGEDETHGGHLMAPMSGTVVAVMVAAGDAVERGTPLLILEAMKMEHTIVAPAPGRVVAVNYAAGERVREGADLVDIDTE
jgi:3-methylcrotonyl-CoA carboxylase alpha subunit